jgi:hypothetical protein
VSTGVEGVRAGRPARTPGRYARMPAGGESSGGATAGPPSQHAGDVPGPPGEAVHLVRRLDTQARRPCVRRDSPTLTAGLREGLDLDRQRVALCRDVATRRFAAAPRLNDERTRGRSPLSDRRGATGPQGDGATCRGQCHRRVVLGGAGRRLSDPRFAAAEAGGEALAGANASSSRDDPTRPGSSRLGRDQRPAEGGR